MVTPSPIISVDFTAAPLPLTSAFNRCNSMRYMKDNREPVRRAKARAGGQNTGYAHSKTMGRGVELLTIVPTNQRTRPFY